MPTILFDQIIFGPVHSRRLGVSLGVNLLPADGKACSFDCIYCECGLNKDRRTHSRMPRREEVKDALETKLLSMKKEGVMPDVITFAGNGEPTIHPDFGAIVDDTIEVRNRLSPETKIAVLSNATMLHKSSVFDALNKIEDNILKLDSVLDSRIQQLNVPNAPSFTFENLLQQLIRFKGNLIIQTMFVRGEYRGESIDNTTTEEIDGWLDALKKINPKQVMIYTIDRETPVHSLRKVSKEDLETIAHRARGLGFEVSVAG
ncbi:MAG: radical SAM protein [Tannerellaceae bacterium]|jgi:wyosine [tRNA(Phe)-imidazoG37] synthetase (radical SAM superfamily)|nr:radical SAM protein [Tannerellaceae bacterium]